LEEKGWRGKLIAGRL